MTTRTVTPGAPRMIPAMTPASRPFWMGGAEGQLRLLRNGKSGVWVHPFDEVAEGDPAFAPDVLSGKGQVFTFTVNHQTYNPAVQPPYVIALVDLDEQAGLRIPTNIVNCQATDLRVGMRVRAVFEPQGELFVPLFEPDL